MTFFYLLLMTVEVDRLMRKQVVESALAQKEFDKPTLKSMGRFFFIIVLFIRSAATFH